MRCACTIPHKQSTDKYNFETCITFGTTISARRSQIAEPQLAHLGPDKRMCAKTHHLSKCMCAFVRMSARACVRVLEQVEYVCVICGVVVRTNISPPRSSYGLLLGLCWSAGKDFPLRMRNRLCRQFSVRTIYTLPADVCVCEMSRGARVGHSRVRDG